MLVKRSGDCMNQLLVKECNSFLELEILPVKSSAQTKYQAIPAHSLYKNMISIHATS
jgi:hypothetical protein